MITAPAGWRTRRRAPFVVLQSPDANMVVAYREVVRPLGAIDALIARELALDPTFHADVIGGVDSLVTDEGEYAAFVTVAGHSGNTLAQHDLGFVLADDYYACAHGVTDSPAHVDELARVVRALVIGDAHMLGVRRRRFLYAAPRGWTSKSAAFETTWLGPRASQAAMVIGAALPIGPSDNDIVERIANETQSSPDFAIAERATPYLLSTPNGLCGTVFELVGAPSDGRHLRRTIALLEDDRYLYPSRLEVVLDGATEEPTAAFFELLKTVQPIPGPRSEAPIVIAPLADYWTA